MIRGGPGLQGQRERDFQNDVEYLHAWASLNEAVKDGDNDSIITEKLS